ncbi:MAG: hypothetical protein R3F53_24845 [Gammaproteobacteria bacterium]
MNAFALLLVNLPAYLIRKERLWHYWPQCLQALGLAALISFCASCQAPVERQQQLAQRLGLSALQVSGSGFSHRLFLNTPAAAMLGTSDKLTAHPPAAFTRLHVYLEGDGDPWLNRTQPASDPTARHPLALRLLASDPAPALYLGRPCYDGLTRTAGCAPRYWTSHRYSEAVVASMAAALRQLPLYQTASDTVLIGHSGGATLAMLLAARLPRIRAVVSLAGNLDPAAWARLHHYSPLTGSLNPALELALPDTIAQIHYLGAADRNIPPALFPATLLQQNNVRMILVEEYNHRCCWLRDWRSLLNQIDKIISKQ